MGIGFYVFAFGVWAWLAFLWFVPSDNPKSLRSQVQNLQKIDPFWKFITHVGIWGGGAAIFLLALIDMM